MIAAIQEHAGAAAELRACDQGPLRALGALEQHQWVLRAARTAMAGGSVCHAAQAAVAAHTGALAVATERPEQQG